MRTYTCDRCGFEVHNKEGIVGKEFERQGFETLSPLYRWPGVVDVCAKCYQDVKLFGQQVHGQVSKEAWKRYREMMAAYAPRPKD